LISGRQVFLGGVHRERFIRRFSFRLLDAQLRRELIRMARRYRRRLLQGVPGAILTGRRVASLGGRA